VLGFDKSPVSPAEIDAELPKTKHKTASRFVKDGSQTSLGDLYPLIVQRPRGRDLQLPEYLSDTHSRERRWPPSRSLSGEWCSTAMLSMLGMRGAAFACVPLVRHDRGLIVAPKRQRAYVPYVRVRAGFNAAGRIAIAHLVCPLRHAPPDIPRAAYNVQPQMHAIPLGAHLLSPSPYRVDSTLLVCTAHGRTGNGAVGHSSGLQTPLTPLGSTSTELRECCTQDLVVRVSDPAPVDVVPHMPG